MDLIIYDLDGTLRTEEQSKHLHPKDPSKAVNWVEWQNHINDNGELITENGRMYEDDVCNHMVLILTSSQYGAHDWLELQGVDFPDYLIERRSYDNREPLLYKTDILHGFMQCGYNVVKWVDNDNRVCNEIRKNYRQIEVVKV